MESRIVITTALICFLIAVLIPLGLTYWPSETNAGADLCAIGPNSRLPANAPERTTREPVFDAYSGMLIGCQVPGSDVIDPVPTHAPVTYSGSTETAATAQKTREPERSESKPANKPAKKNDAQMHTPKIRHPMASSRTSKREAAMIMAGQHAIPSFDGFGLGFSAGGGTEAVSIGVSRRQTDYLNLTGNVMKSGHDEKIAVGLQVPFW